MRTSPRRTDGGDEPPARQRIDKWLWFARVTKTRPLAAGLVAAGHVRVNGARVEAPGHAIKVGDVLTIALERRVRVLEVLDPGLRRGPAPEAALLYRDRAEGTPPLRGEGKGDS